MLATCMSIVYWRFPHLLPLASVLWGGIVPLSDGQRAIMSLYGLEQCVLGLMMAYANLQLLPKYI